MARTVLWMGQPTELAGPELQRGDRAPSDFSLISADLRSVRGSEAAGRPRILLSAPSLDTPVCDAEARRFNREAVKIPGVSVLVATMDLPFAQQRWCAGAAVDRVKALSDHRERSFGRAYGVVMPAFELLARAVFVVDRDDVIQYVEVVADVGQEPDYEAALAAARGLT